MDYRRLGLVVAEMLDIGYTNEWISYLMDIYKVPDNYERPDPYQSKYLFCKELFEELSSDYENREIIVDIANYIIRSERFDKRLEEAARKHLPIFKDLAIKSGLTDSYEINNRSAYNLDFALYPIEFL